MNTAGASMQEKIYENLRNPARARRGVRVRNKRWVRNHIFF
jgi:hypothetical protein